MRADARYDAIVLGLGAMGSAASCHLARRGARVLGLDAFARGHANGSSHGRSRAIREAYAESPQYVPLVQRAYALWRDLEAESGRRLLTITGGISIGPAAVDFVASSKAAAVQYGLGIEELSADEIMARWPVFRVPAGYVGVHDPRAGCLVPEPCVAAHLDLAARHGADLHHGEPVRRWLPDGAGVRVETDAGAYIAQSLVVTAGSWANELVSDLHLPLEVLRMYTVYVAPTRPELFAPDRFPVWGLRVPEGTYYGMATLQPGDGVKVARHDKGEVCTPQTARRTVTPEEIAAARAVLAAYLPAAADGRTLAATTCLYTMTPDGHFIVDRHPERANVVYACGFSGHGFKFSPVIGEVLADLVTAGTTRHEIGFLSASRFGGRIPRTHHAT